MIFVRYLRNTIVLAQLGCVLAAPLHSQQRYYERWYFGFNAGLDFSSGAPRKAFGALFSKEGCASICDPNSGQLLFSTNGVSVWTRNHTVMKGGTGLFGSVTSSQSATIVPKPGDPNVFYIFTVSAGPYEQLPAGRLRQVSYSTVDMTREGGLGEVVQKNVFLMQPTAEKFVAVPHCNGVDYWAIGHELGSARFFAWLVTANGVSATPVITDIGLVNDAESGTTGSIGYLKASPDARFLFSIVQQEGKGELFAFDNENGIVERLIATIPAHYSASFSPNSELLYIENSVLNPQINSYVIVFNDKVLDGVSILNTRRLIAELPRTTPPRSFRALQIGPDRKLYVAVDKHIGVIEDPDFGGRFLDSLITFEPKDLIGDTVPANGLPNCIDAFLASMPLTFTCAVPDSIEAKFRPSDTAICEGETIDFTDESFEDPIAWRWTFAGGTPATSNVRHPKGIRFDRAGTYPVRLIASKATVADTVEKMIVVHPKPVADAGRDRVLCMGDTAHLKASGGGTYFWSPTGGLSCDNCPDPIATPVATTVYLLTVTNQFGCTDVDSVRVEVLPQITLSATPDTGICLGGSIELNVSGADIYEWSPADGLSCTDCPNPTATPLKTTTYSIRGTAGGGNCFDYDTIVVVVHDPPVAEAGADTAVCEGGSVRLSASGGVAFRWAASSDLSCTECPDPIATPFEAAVYHVTVIDANGCEATDSVAVDVHPAPIVDAGEDRQICAGGSARLTATGGTAYRWEDSPDLSCLDCPDPVASPSRTTTYRVTVIDAKGCQASDSVSVVVRGIPVVDAGENATICRGESVRLNASGGVTYRWDPSSDLSCLDCPDPVAAPTAPTVYYVTVTDASGCEGRDSVFVDLRSFAVTLERDRVICSGDAVRLGVTGGVAWSWDPSPDLSCADCPDPVASPAATTTYRVTVTSADGCTVVDSVRVRVRENREPIRVRIGRDHRAAPGELIRVPVEVIDAVVNSNIDELTFELEYDENVMLLDPATIQRLADGTLLEGWSIKILETTPGRASLRFTAPAGETLSGDGILLVFGARLFLSHVLGTELPFLLTSPSNCFAFVPEPGYAEVDSVCGLSLRLIRASAEKYAAPVAYPNPASDRVRLEFGLGLPGRVTLELFDAAGNRTGVLVNDDLDAGEYQVEWDARNVPSGLYYCRMTSGSWSGTGTMFIAK